MTAFSGCEELFRYRCRDDGPYEYLTIYQVLSLPSIATCG